MIKILPDSVANQIAAGEVVQRPASVVKELMENAVDAEATQITLLIKDAGRTLIQVIDNGSGMTDMDARLAFDRHATSKIQSADDLSRILTFGFRGEALASIASVADVELKTRRADSETGTHVHILASEVIGQQTASCPVGANFAVKNLFFNVPARRKFLKTDAVELRHIVTEFQRVAICNPWIAFSFINNGNNLYTLAKGNLRQRLIGIFGKAINNTLITVSVNTSIVNISGYVGKAEDARKTAGEQFFFVNNRYFRSAYFQKAVMKAYGQLLPDNTFPAFFIFFEIDPSKIDINIHPTKTEIKFEDEQAIWQMLNAGVRESLSRFAVAPTIIFDTEGADNIPVLTKNIQVNAPNIEVEDDYNPFIGTTENKSAMPDYKKTTVPKGWEKLYAGLERNVQNSIENFENNKDETDEQQNLDIRASVQERRCLQIKGKYILTSVKSGLMVIEQNRAHQRILFEKFMNRIGKQSLTPQHKLYPQTIDLSPSDFILIDSILDDLLLLGFDIRSAGDNCITVYAFPIELSANSIEYTINGILNGLKEHGGINIDTRKYVAVLMAKTAAIGVNRVLNEQEMQHLVDSLFACTQPDISPEGKSTLTIIGMDELDKRI
ncbi:MAG: DNA mismatch repair endonuclease MutL [Prevotellaceae bacterium]|jgi:DNA mismatch repair protein MutL|nr:DNA mismatch repair endonuclease MutL [Prevotellaceae bacterium]